MNNKLKIWETALLISLCITLFTGAWAGSRQAGLSQKLIRLHVVAVSDDDSEQAIKLEVRDAVLDYLAPLLSEAGDAKTAGEIIEDNLSGVEHAALSRSRGRQVIVTLGPEEFPTRHYESFSLPAGEYESLRVTLGEGEGHNWWCVVFPPLCVEAAGSDAELVQSVLSADDAALITRENGEYALRFRVLELWGELRSLLNRLSQ